MARGRLHARPAPRIHRSRDLRLGAGLDFPRAHLELSRAGGGNPGARRLHHEPDRRHAGHRRSQARRGHQCPGQPVRAQGLDHLLRAQRQAQPRSQLRLPLSQLDLRLRRQSHQHRLRGRHPGQRRHARRLRQVQAQAHPLARRDHQGPHFRHLLRTRLRRSGTTSAR